MSEYKTIALEDIPGRRGAKDPRVALQAAVNALPAGRAVVVKVADKKELNSLTSWARTRKFTAVYRGQTVYIYNTTGVEVAPVEDQPVVLPTVTEGQVVEDEQLKLFTEEEMTAQGVAQTTHFEGEETATTEKPIRRRKHAIVEEAPASTTEF